VSRPSTLTPPPRLRRRSAAEISEVRGALRRFLAVGLVALVVVAVPFTIWVRQLAENRALHLATEQTQRLADYAVGPLVTAELLAGEPAFLDQLDQRLRPWLDQSLIRIKVWDAHGEVVYSDMRSLIGQNFGLEDWMVELLEGGPATSTLELQDDGENLYESGSGELVEVYVRSEAADGAPLIFEAYYSDDDVMQEKDELLLSTAPVVLLALIVLQATQLLPAVRLARRIQDGEATRRRLLQRALDASDMERRRIARELHDEVIQELAGLGYAVEAEERHAPEQHRGLLVRARTILQNNVRTLRGMTTELYPPDLEEVGLTGALARLAAPFAEQGLTVSLDVPDQDDLDLDRDHAAVLYRIAREAVTNTVKHAAASAVELSLRQDADRTVMLIRDDGLGFDPSDGSPDGHFGLTLMRDSIEEAGGSLEVSSRVGAGTVVTAALARPATV
jgi:signal transduction histidine kinase